jgi:hypothetical protein
MKNFFWSGYCSKDRIVAISEIEKIVSAHGFITDFKLFSDVAISIQIESEELNIDKLYTSLSDYISLNAFEKLNSDSSDECLVSLNITFTKGTGDLKIEVPAVPG